jgi:hypothetical protein
MDKLKTYEEIKHKMGGEIPYHIQLLTKEWFHKRNKIIQRDKDQCQLCKQICVQDWAPKYVGGGNVILVPGIIEEITVVKTVNIPFSDETIKFNDIEFVFQEVTTPYFPNVHHTYYIQGRLAWEYPDEDLILLCHKCHLKFHQENTVNVYLDYKNGTILTYSPCNRCHGAGYFDEYKHVENGICFRCKGARYEELIEQGSV